MSRFKTKHSKQGRDLPAEAIKPQDHNAYHPAFCFKYLQKGKYHLDSCIADDAAALAKRLVKLGEMTWQQVLFADKRTLGSETIKRNAIRSGLPACLPEDAVLLALRFNSSKPMVGFRDKKLFYVLWLDHDFTLYDHG